MNRQLLLITFAEWFKNHPMAKVFVPPPFQLSLKLDWLRLMPVLKSFFHLLAKLSASTADWAVKSVVDRMKISTIRFNILQMYEKVFGYLDCFIGF